MKKIIFFLILATALLGFNACSKTEKPGVAKCATKSCFPVDNWKLRSKPHNGDCMDCHTSCAPAAMHGCVAGESWNKPSDAICMACHSGAKAPH